MLAKVGDQQQTVCDIQLPHVDSAYNNSVRAATGLVPDEMHMGRLPRLRYTVFDLPKIIGHRSLNRNQLPHIDHATARQQCACRGLEEIHAIYVSRLDHRNAPLVDARYLLSPFSVNGWESIYNSTATICCSGRKGNDPSF